MQSKPAPEKIVQFPCVFYPRGATKEGCEEKTRVSAHNARCAGIHCPSKSRFCVKCINESSRPDYVTNPVTGLCARHDREKQENDALPRRERVLVERRPRGGGCPLILPAVPSARISGEQFQPQRAPFSLPPDPPSLMQRVAQAAQGPPQDVRSSAPAAKPPEPELPPEKVPNETPQPQPIVVTNEVTEVTKEKRMPQHERKPARKASRAPERPSVSRRKRAKAESQPPEAPVELPVAPVQPVPEPEPTAEHAPPFASSVRADLVELAEIARQLSRVPRSRRLARRLELITNRLRRGLLKS
ncbi:MAG TPA: hypothetical protein VGB97_00865 [Candidatus Paceibacterota bacterium]|jgi:hypothetical protein